ncbi:MAG: PEP-CTERM sorting domain-containing protein [Phycisphaeraceae bacterium]|nr:PEP-CTERM sorting domain-containing protein [Phycisphaeraceae bacterium]
MNARINLSAALACALACGSVASATNLIVNGDFQTGSLGPSTSSYANLPFPGDADPPIDSIYDPTTYAIVTFDTIHESWADFYDHTFGDQRGFYMIVNGADDGTGPAWAQTVALAPNTEYDLSAWFASLNAISVASLEFRIIGNDSTIISPQFFAPMDIPDGGPGIGVWEMRTLIFNSGANTSASIEIWDTNGIFFGNDYAIDDISLTVVPAPGSLALTGLALGAALRRRRRSA